MNVPLKLPIPLYNLSHYEDLSTARSNPNVVKSLFTKYDFYWTKLWQYTVLNYPIVRKDCRDVPFCATIGGHCTCGLRVCVGFNQYMLFANGRIL